MRRGPVPGRILNELPAYLHVLINHKMSPRGRIKLSISLYLLLAPRHTHCSPPLHSPASLRPQAFPLPSSPSFSKYSVHHCHGRSPEGEGKGKIIGGRGKSIGHMLSLAKHDMVTGHASALSRPGQDPPAEGSIPFIIRCLGPVGGQVL